MQTKLQKAEQRIEEARKRIEEARSRQSESLDLGDLALTEFPASLGDLTHLRTLALGRYRLTEAGAEWDFSRESAVFTDLSPLAGLAGLQSLDLGGTGVTDLSLLAGLAGLQSLNLVGTGVTDLSPLTGLAGLQSLGLVGTGVMDLSPLAGLAGLQSLDLGGTGVTDLSPLAGLAGLRSLDLGRTGVTDLSPLTGLAGLQSLDLGRTRVADLSPLAGLVGLQSLDLRGTGVTGLSPLAGLAGLQSLDLGRTGVTDLAPLAGLAGLRSLDLVGTGVTDLSPLAGLAGLQSLGLVGTGVTDLSPLAGLAGLQSLGLEGTGVRDLSPLAGLAGLQSLGLEGTGVRDLSPLAGLAGLQILDLYGRPAVPDSLLRDLANHPRLTVLWADEAAGIPREVLSHDPFDNCLPRLRAYLSELELGAEAENEVKMILLGNGRVGKTQLCRRFRGEEFDDSVASTHGVQIWRQPLRLRVEGKEQVFQVNWWDFGGQDIYHGTHALFLRSRAVFLVLWTPGLENRDEYEDENGIPLRNQPLAYWLDYVRSLAGADSPVIVVQSQCDRFADRRPCPARPEGFGFFESCSYSARAKEEESGREVLEAHLRDAMRYLLERSGALEIGQGRAEVRRRLYKWRGEDQEHNPEERRHRTLTLEELRALCEEVGGIASWEHALDYFHQTGVVFYRPDLFSQRIVLDQDWALDAVYAVFDRGRAVPLLRDSGRFTREDLALLVWQEHAIEEQKLFLGLMESCGVCFPCGETARGEARYVAPDLLPGFAAVAGRLHAWKEEAETPTLRLKYRFFHPAVIRGLMSDVARKAGDLAEYWKYGLWLKDGWRDSQLLVRFEDTSTDEAPGAGALELKAQGRYPLGLLREIRRAILWQRIGEEPEELLTLDGTTVARSALAAVIAGQVLDLEGKPVSAAPVAAFFEDWEHHPDEPRELTEPLADTSAGAPLSAKRSPPVASPIDVKPEPLTESDKPPEVFLSYAWGDDDSPEGKIRTQAIEGLYTALLEDGFLPVRDRAEIRSGERISAFIRRLTRADLVVALISDKYVRSPYCMYEIYRLWQRFQADGDLLAEHLVPVVLPDVRIGSLEEREPYIDHWRQRLATLKRLIRKLDLKAGRESYQEARLVDEFAHHVDDILCFLDDIYMSRDLKLHLDDGFQAVRDALRQRIAPAR